MQWRILQHKIADDFVISTNKECKVREFVNKTCDKLGFQVAWSGKGIKEIGYVKKIIKKKENCKIIEGQKIIFVSKKYLRPNDVTYLRGDSKKARKKLNWKPEYSLDSLITEMISNDMRLAKDEFFLKKINEKK